MSTIHTGADTAPVAGGAVPDGIPAHLRRPRLLVNEASAYLVAAHGVHVAVATLRKYRTVGGGPTAQRFGARLLYRPADLDAWVASKIGPATRSTSEK